MILLLDIGNTRLKWAWSVEGTLEETDQSRYRVADLGDALTAHFQGARRPQRVFVSNVAGADVGQILSGWVGRTWNLETQYLTAQASQCGVTCAYIDPGTLGADRWAALIAAHHRFRDNVCIVDCGSAITIDALAANGEHLGGLIVPGIRMMRRSLSQNTDGIPEVTSGNVSLLARHTHDGVTAGTLYAAVAVVDRVVSDVETELGQSVACVVTGGDAETIHPLLAHDVAFEPNLVLEGLAVIAESGA